MNEPRDVTKPQAGLSQSAWFDRWTGEETLDLRHYGRIIRNRWWVILSILSIVFVAYGIKVYRTPSEYKATGTIAIEPTTQQIMTDVEGFDASDKRGYESQAIQLQLDILRSQAVAERVVDRLKLWEHPDFSAAVSKETDPENRRTRLLDKFRERLTIEKPRDLNSQRVIPVSYRSSEARLATEIVNTLFEEFIAYNRKRNADRVDFAADWLVHQLATLEDEIKKKRENLVKYQQQSELLYMGDTEMKEDQNPSHERFAKLNSALAEVEANRIQAEVLYRLSQSGGVSQLPATMTNPVLDELRQQRVKLQMQLDQQRGIYQDDAPPIKQLKQQLADLDLRIEQAQQALLEQVRKEYRLAAEKAQAMTEAVERERAEILKQNQASLQFSLLKREIEVDEKVFQMLSERLREANLMKTLAPSSNIQIVDKARVPLEPAQSKAASYLLGLLVGLVLGVAGAFVLEFLDDSLKTTEEVESLLRLPHLSMIPKVAGYTDKAVFARQRSTDSRPLLLEMDRAAGNVFTEAYRTLRTSLLLSSATHPPRAVVVTSYEAGVGKTTIAANLAIALAQAGKRVLLLDADMRHPNCATMFNVDTEAGLSTYLSFDDKPASIYHDCGVVGLDLLASGPVPPNPSELLHSERMGLLLESLSQRYDHVIIDTPPLGLVSDALILATLVDGVLLVVKLHATSRRGIRRVKNRLDAVNAKILGVVLNAVDTRQHRYGYYGYGSYYYGQSDKSPKSERVARS